MARSGDWFATYIGVQYYLTDPHPSDVRVEDIGHALSMVCRFGGHTKQFYSVAQHSCHVSELVGEGYPKDYRLQLHALLHDSSEAYLSDIVRPLKLSMPNYQALERRTMDVIYEALLLPDPSPEQHAVIKNADDVLLMTERETLITHRDIPWAVKAKPLAMVIEPWSPSTAEYRFITHYNLLRGLTDNAHAAELVA